MDQPAGSQVPVLDPAPDRHADDRVPLGAWITAAVFVAVMLAVSGRYGFMQDEMYFIVAGHHLAFGYVDQPPLAPLLTRITDIFGVNPTAVRILPALAGGATVVAAAKLAALFGAGRFGRVLGPGSASDRIVLVVWTREYIGKLSAAFASCRVLSTYYAPYHVQNNWTDLQIGVCTGPVASWTVLWPYLRHYD